MRALLLLGGLLILMVGLVTWKIARAEPTDAKSSLGRNQGELVLGVEAGRERSLGSTPESGARGAEEPSEGGGAAPPSSRQQPESDPLPEDDRRGAVGGDPPGGDGPLREPPREEPAPVPPPAPVAPLAYVVQEGDTLYSIVRRAYGNANEDLIEAVAGASGLADPSRLAVGDELRFPTVEGFTAPRMP